MNDNVTIDRIIKTDFQVPEHKSSNKQWKPYVDYSFESKLTIYKKL